MPAEARVTMAWVDFDTRHNFLLSRNVIKAQTGALVRMSSATTVAPKIGVIRLSDGSRMHADGQLAGTPSAVFDAIAIVLSEAGAAALVNQAAAVDFVRDAYGHLNAIAIDAGGHVLLQEAGVQPDAGVVAAHAKAAFIEMVSTRQWERELKVRSLA